MAFALAAAALLGATASSCGFWKGPVNASPSLRWWLFSNFGAQRMCPEMLKRSTALRLTAGGNAVGRFFPEQCRTQVNDASQTVLVNFSGTGYAWTPVAGRVGFWASAAVEYRMDFFLGDDAMYIWARTARIASGPEFRMGAIEYKLANFAAQGPAGYLLNTFGSQLMESQLAKGFTVVHSDEGDAFWLGHLTPPQRPPSPFVQGKNRFVFANETTEVRTDQVDLLGPFEVVDRDQALFLRMNVTGPAVDVLLVTRSAGDVFRAELQLGGVLKAPNTVPVSTWVVRPGGEQQQMLRLPPGQYYAIVDNSARLGSVNPPWSPLGVIGGSTAVVSYIAELGDAD
ncbi:MAG TPA: hypothetical protein VFQ61_02745 [Polyangiaceae bacterium]|nr:hypothetical protein [Polyangiaceae bacterium]